MHYWMMNVSLNKTRRDLEINKPERSQINNLMIHCSALENEDQTKPQSLDSLRSGKESME